MAALEGDADDQFDLDLSDEMNNSGSGMNIEPRTQRQDEA